MRKKSGRHLQLRMVMKTLKRSRKVIEILNHLGHCVSYNLVEEIEIELIYAANEKDILTPSEINMDTTSCTDLTFDNYDCLVETLTVKTTVVITYQKVKLDDTIDNNPSTNQETTETNPST